MWNLLSHLGILIFNCCSKAECWFLFGFLAIPWNIGQHRGPRTRTCFGCFFASHDAFGCEGFWPARKWLVCQTCNSKRFSRVLPQLGDGFGNCGNGKKTLTRLFNSWIVFTWVIHFSQDHRNSKLVYTIYTIAMETWFKHYYQSTIFKFLWFSIAVLVCHRILFVPSPVSCWVEKIGVLIVMRSRNIHGFSTRSSYLLAH